MPRKLKVLVLYGGRSAEHEVSLQSAATVIAGLDSSRYTPFPVYIDRQGRWWLQADGGAGRSLKQQVVLSHRSALLLLGRTKTLVDVDAAFPLVHGSHGEDGTLQGALELSGIAYAGSGVLGSSLGMDKPASKLVAHAAGLRVPDDVVIRAGDSLKDAEREARKLGLPLFVKPACQGSSVGVRKVSRWNEFAAAVRYALRFDTKALAEEAVEGGVEISVAVLGDERQARASVPGAIRATHGHKFYTYEAKYLDPDGHELTIPAPISKSKTQEVQAEAVNAFHALEGYGMARVDFLLDKKGTLYFGEVNTIPGFTSHSLYPKLWEKSGLPLPRLLDRLIALALRRGRRQARLLIKPN